MIKRILISGLLMLPLAIFLSVGCAPMAIATHQTLALAGIDSEIALVDVGGVESYGHCVIIIDGEPFEPRFLGLWLADNIDYDHPISVYPSVEAYLDDGNPSYIPPDVVYDALVERLGDKHITIKDVPQ